MSAENGERKFKPTLPAAQTKMPGIKKTKPAATPLLAKRQSGVIKKEPDAAVQPSTSAAAAAALATDKADLLKLSTLSKPRDLTLGGLVNPTNKKVYTPNLNVVRNKNTNVRTSKDTSRGRGERGRGRGRGARGGGAQFIQTAGVFAEGAGELHTRKSLIDRSAHNDKSDYGQMRRPIINKNMQKVDIHKDEEYVREILEGSDDDYKDAGVNMHEMPVKLSEAASLRVKMEREGMLAAEGDKSIPPEHVHVQSLKQLFDAATPQIFVMQLPDTLPFECDDDENSDDDVPKGLRTSKPMPKTHSLKEMEEGRVGKIVRYKSRRVKLILGESHFNLEFGMEPGCVQDIMSINTNSEERSANMINLGPINGKVTVVPDWEHMLHQHDLKVNRES